MSQSIGPAFSVVTGFRSRRRRRAVAVLLGWLLLAQTLLVVHRIDHNSAGHGVSCSLCVAADHSAATGEAAIHIVADLKPAPVAAGVRESATLVVVLPYRSRAPPPHLAS